MDFDELQWNLIIRNGDWIEFDGIALWSFKNTMETTISRR